MRSIITFVLCVGSAVAAPVPKALKKPNVSPDGVWQLREFNGHNGKVSGKQVIDTYWRIDGEKMSRARKTKDELTPDALEFTLKAADPENPKLRKYTVGAQTTYTTLVEVDGDTLRWAWCTDQTKTVAECKPADDVYYYVFERVKE